jgi:hypothetical protein
MMNQMGHTLPQPTSGGGAGPMRHASSMRAATEQLVPAGERRYDADGRQQQQQSGGVVSATAASAKATGKKPRSGPSLSRGALGTLPDDGATAALQAVVADFPRAQRLHIMFLHAADSHRLNAHVAHAMAAKLRSLQKQCRAGGQAGPLGLSERAVAMGTLAGFLGYVAFGSTGIAAAADGDGGSGEEGSGSSSSSSSVVDKGQPAFDGSHPLDVLGALQTAARDGTLPWMLPWAVSYLRFLRWEGGGRPTPYFK